MACAAAAAAAFAAPLAKLVREPNPKGMICFYVDFFLFSGLVIWNILSSSSVATITTIDLYISRSNYIVLFGQE